MKNISEALEAYETELQTNAAGALLGEEESRLLENLEKIIARNRKVFHLIIFLLVVAYVLAISCIWYWQENTAVMASIFAASGISVPWAINMIIGLWKDISNAETLHVLISHLNDKATTRKIVMLISEKVYR